MGQRRNRQGAQWLLHSVSGVAVALVVLSVPLSAGSWRNAVVLLAAGCQQPVQTAAAVQQQMALYDGTASESLSDAVPVVSPSLPSSDSLSTTSTAASEPTASVTVAGMISPPAEDGSGGKIVEQKVSTGSTLSNGIATRNRSGKTVDFAGALHTALSMTFAETDAPQVLIVHTHTTENYMRYDAGYYNADDRKRSQNHSYTVCAVGEALKQTLADNGIVAIHDTTVHDSPHYTGAYTRSAETVQRYLDLYPSIRVVLDLHRDAIMSTDTTLVKPTVSVNGKKAAQMMILVGTVSTQALPNPNTQTNLALATQWQRELTAVHGDLMRPLTAVASRYNQHLHAGYLLVEVGAEGNTVEEAVYSAELLGKTLAKLLKKDGGT